MPLTLDRVREVIDYDPWSGGMKWRVKLANRAPAGSDVSPNTARPYKFVGIDGKQYPAHRLAWFWTFGEWPRQFLDHIDGDGKNNAIGNLRDVSQSVNMQNIKTHRADNALGALGVIRRHSKFRAQIRVGGKTKYLGTYATKEEAADAYLRAKREMHEGCTL